MSIDYRPRFLFRSGHFNTIYAGLLRQQEKVSFTVEEVTTPDNDFLHLDFIRRGHKRIAILCHGLEGSSDSNYINGTSSILSEHGWDVVALNYRGCSGVMNRQLRMYHSGATDDLETAIAYASAGYDEVALVGFSLGGNLVLKYCGEQGANISSQIVACASISVPTDLQAGSLNIGKKSNYFYEKKFMDSLKLKVIAKHKQFPEAIDISLLKGMKKLFDFDDRFTGPLHGFRDAKDYYTKCSSQKFLGGITIPTLIINALDDPFLPKECYPYKLAAQNKNIELLTPKYGGHVGFSEIGKKHYWDELIINQFLNERSGQASSPPRS